MTEQNTGPGYAKPIETNEQRQLEDKLERIRDIDNQLQDLQSERSNLSADVEKLREQINDKLHEASVVFAGEYRMDTTMTPARR